MLLRIDSYRQLGVTLWFSFGGITLVRKLLHMQSIGMCRASSVKGILQSQQVFPRWQVEQKLGVTQM